MKPELISTEDFANRIKYLLAQESDIVRVDIDDDAPAVTVHTKQARIFMLDVRKIRGY